jgi:menaquinone-9 beta-reductase
MITGTVWDAVVVGAGPAGAVTSLQLARAGHRVALLERRVFPRAKPCGDCLSPEAARVLDRLGLLPQIDAAVPARLDGWRIWAPDGRSFRGTFERHARGDARVESALAISRERLDAALLDAALAAGVELHAPLRAERLLRERAAVTGVLARDEQNREVRFDARVVVGADGLRSIVARQADATAAPGPLRKLSFTLHPRLSTGFTGGAGEMHVVRGGCIGIAPVERGDGPLYNVTFVTLAPSPHGGARETIEAMLRAAPGLADRLPELRVALGECAKPLASGPFDRPVRYAVADGLALVGDAAGYYDPFTGQGVYQALSGGERLARVLDDALRTDARTIGADALAPYARWLARTRRPARTVQRAIEFVTSRPRLMARCTRALERAPLFADTLVAVTGDIAPARALVGRPLLSVAGAFIETRSRSTA